MAAIMEVVPPAPSFGEEVEEEEEELVDIPQSEKEADPFYEALITREIDGVVHKGKVEDIEQGKISNERLYRVRYEDNDLEHFTAKEVETHLDHDAMQETRAKLPTAAVAKRPSSAEEGEEKEEGIDAEMDEIDEEKEAGKEPPGDDEEAEATNDEIPTAYKKPAARGQVKRPMSEGTAKTTPAEKAKASAKAKAKAKTKAKAKAKASMVLKKPARR